MMGSIPEISIDLAEDEWIAMTDELDNRPDSLSATACAALLSASPHPGGILGRHFQCSVSIAREFLAWCEAAHRADDPDRGTLLNGAARNVRFALWRVGEGPPPEPIQWRP